MNILKKLGLAFASLAFVMALSVVSANAQPGKAGWNGNNGKHRGWTQGQHRGWNKGRKTGWQDRNSWWSRQTDRRYRTGRYDDYKYRRLERQRERLYNSRNRYYSDGYLSDKERRKLNKRYQKYQTNRRIW